MDKGPEAGADNVIADFSWCPHTCLSLDWSEGSQGALTTDAHAEELENEPFLKSMG